ncbi:MAG: hypothetical protein P4L84_26815 [Isosphaeraceae bacterium]|nr:hypothetical protein [Isosphaeraceae bacterium]
MRRVLGQLLKPILVPLLAWSTLGMQVDLISGPLTPQAALRAICAILLPANQAAEQAKAPLLRAVAVHSSPFGRPTTAPSSTPPFVLKGADWTTPVIPTTPAQASVPRVAAPGVVVAASPLPESSLPPNFGPLAVIDVRLSLRLCRLHC